MDFVLRYRGPLRGSSRPDSAEKQRLRLYFHPQLRELCHREEHFKGAALEVLPAGSLESGRVKPPRKTDGTLEAMFFRIPIGGYDFIPLIHRPHQLACQMDILWLRRERAGDIVHGGDLDNRLKNLLDGLRMPLEEKEVGVQADQPGMRCYCLLEDDALITKLSVTTHQLLEPLPPEHESHDHHDVDLLIHVVVQSLFPMWANIGL